MTNNDFLNWLIEPTAARLTLLEVAVNVDGTEIIRYLSTKPYTSEGVISPIAYLPVVVSGVKFTEQLSLTGEASLSAADLELDNTDGSLDTWLMDAWENRAISAFVGGPDWVRSDFRQVFSGQVADIAVSSRDKLSLKLRDKLQQLNTPVSEAKLGGSGTSKDTLLPLTFGECHNVTALLADPATLTYTYHAGAAEGVIEVRDNGKPVEVTQSPTTGQFTLTATPAEGVASGGITASVQGDKFGGTYINTIALIIKRLVTGYGNAVNRFTDADIDLPNFTAFEAAHPQPVGLYLPDRTNVLVACQQLAGSVGAQIVMSRSGKLRLYQINLPPQGGGTSIGPSDMVQFSLRVQEKRPVAAAVKLNFCKSHTVQPGLLTTIPEEHKTLYAEEWLTATAMDLAAKTLRKLEVEPVAQDTALLVRSDAQAEAGRRLGLVKAPRRIFQFEGLPQMLLLELGQSVTLTDSRFGLAAGVQGLVISLAVDWKTCRVTVGVLV